MKKIISILTISLLVMSISCGNLLHEAKENQDNAGNNPDNGEEVTQTIPSVNNTTPANGSTNVALNTQIIVEFSEEMDANTITTETLTISIDETNVEGSILYTGTSAIFTPSANLTVNSIYSGKVTVAAKSKNGIALTSDFTWSFTTETTKDTVGSVSFNMVNVPGKSFFTGADDGGIATVSNAYLIGETEVTYELWYTVYDWAVNGTGIATGEGQYTFANPGVRGDSGGGTDQHPVTTINWRDAMVWMNALTEYYNAQNGTSLACVYNTDLGYTTPLRTSTDSTDITDIIQGSQDAPYVNAAAKGFRLLTSYEWALAARYISDANSNGDIMDAGEYYPGSYASGATADYTDFDATSLVAWFGNSTTPSIGNTISTQPVGQKTPNALGLYDMSGNVGEWTFEWNTQFITRKVRGYSWSSPDYGMKIGAVGGEYVYNEGFNVGFRLARTP